MAATARPVHILGAGSIGLLFGEAIVSKGIPCTLILRNQAKLAALAAAQGRVTVERQHISQTSTNTSCSNSSSDAYQVAGEVAEQTAGSSIKQLIVTTKANHAVPAIASVKHRLSSDSVVLLLTNGVLGVYLDVVRTLFPPGGVGQHPAFLLGMTTHGAYRKGDFHVLHAGLGSFVAGVPPQDIIESAAAAAAAVATATSSSSTSSATSSSTAEAAYTQQTQQCSTVGLEALQLLQARPQQRQQHVREMLSLLATLEQLHPNTALSAEQLQQQLLLKLVVNCCSNPMSGLLHCRNGGLPGNAHAELVWKHVIRECKAVFGDKLPGSEQELFDKVSHVVRINGNNYNSMLQDVIQRVPTEVDYLNGFVVQQGAAAGVATPWNEMLATLVHARQAVPHQLLTTESM